MDREKTNTSNPIRILPIPQQEIQHNPNNNIPDNPLTGKKEIRNYESLTNIKKKPYSYCCNIISVNRANGN